jgi:hypothetical protein
MRTTIMRLWMGGLSAAAVLGFNVTGAFGACTTTVNSIDSFICCVNENVKAGGNVSNAVQCLPPGCSVTLTMSNQSAQAACTLGTCQLPRVLLTCPGPGPDLFFRPSFLLCPQDSGTAPNYGMDRVELGEDVEDGDGDMLMADVPFAPGHVALPFDEDEVKNNTDNDKSCNDESIGCHKAGTDDGDFATSEPIDPFGNPIGGIGINGADYIISTDEECKEAEPDESMFTAQNLSDICTCIKDNRAAILAAAGDDAEKRMNVLLALCQALSRYQYSHGVCGGVVTPNGGEPPMCPPGCAEAGMNGQFMSGATKFNANIYVSGSTTYPMGPDPTYTFDERTGVMSVHDTVTGNTIAGPVYTSAELMSSGGGNYTLEATATVKVNGTPTMVDFTATKTGTVVTYSIKRASDMTVLSSGTGVAGKSWFTEGFGAPN